MLRHAFFQLEAHLKQKHKAKTIIGWCLACGTESKNLQIFKVHLRSPAHTHKMCLTSLKPRECTKRKSSDARGYYEGSPPPEETAEDFLPPSAQNKSGGKGGKKKVQIVLCLCVLCALEQKCMTIIHVFLRVMPCQLLVTTFWFLIETAAFKTIGKISS